MSGVDLRINIADLAGTFEHMRIWLDHEDCIPVNFDQIGDQNGTIIIHVDFEDDELADAFHSEFIGSHASS
jgi:hypothetical protein